MSSKLPRVVPIYTRSGLVHDLGTQDRKALLAFLGMEEELCIFNRTQGEVARYGDSLQILSCRDVSSRYAYQPMPSQEGSCKLGALIQMSLKASIASRSELLSESVKDKLSLRYHMMRT
ncbi:hypothetical protein TIFTF001_045735 [Ficus carica]|uniref:Uncharacterized protein n=1 Tax=Ficus carica TaxID=3494 RepID=A0AA87YVB9_FICCA|nr:hypothetical protein TIFTF001_045732 [Ficus carica]GMN22927.1 hypothetical protein TIFTF001_045733 [Ficus carica]GMN22935.1 hypothetical protein TIFTF001_045734 [Ficus carica]GMN22948.1 hypothetical protein TIFTF001_045735 [Ficus carica]